MGNERFYRVYTDDGWPSGADDHGGMPAMHSAPR